MAMALPIAMFAASIIKSKMDSDAAQAGDAAMRQAGRDKINAMRQGAADVERYRQNLMPQQLQAMQNQMAMYGGAQNVLSQMYGGHPPAQTGTRLPPSTSMQAPGMYRPGGLLGQMGQPGPPPPGYTPPPGGARAGNPLDFMAAPMVPNVGFGGEMPFPSALRRKV